MNRLTRSQRDNVVNFRRITNSSESVAIQCLSGAGWDLETGIDVYFTSWSSKTPLPATSTKKIEELFCQYSGPGSDLMLADGIGRLCDDLEVDPADIVLLVISWHMSAATMCEYTKQEFVSGLTSLGCDSLVKLKALLPILKLELEDDVKFREIYNYAFLFSREKGQKCLQLETATAMWQLLFSCRPWNLIDSWCEFLQKNHNR